MKEVSAGVITNTDEEDWDGTAGPSGFEEEWPGVKPVLVITIREEDTERIEGLT